jgi:peptidoglycan DL-endopeptidase CwlO
MPRWGVKTFAVVAAALLAALVLFLVVIVGGASGGGLVTTAGATIVSQDCTTNGPVRGLDAVQARNARTVVAIATEMGGDQAAVIAISVGLAESGLLVLGNPVVPGLGVLQGDGFDHDSIGIFQQRASWGTMIQRLDPATSTRLFVTRLLAKAGWETESPWAAAQDVQRSAYDGRPRPTNNQSAVYGGNYRATFPAARRIVTVVTAGADECGALHGGSPANTAPGSHGLPADYTIPATATPTESTVVAYALGQLNKPYVFDTAGPDAFDCSGLTMTAWAQVGVALPHWTVGQARAGTAVADANRMVPGDLVLVPGDDGTLAAPGHVGLYIGDGLVENASDPAAGIRVQTYDDFVQAGHGLSAIRHIE